MTSGFLIVQVLLTFLFLTVKPVRDVIACSGAYLMCSFGTAIFVHPEKWTGSDVVDKVMNGLLCFAALGVMAIVLSYLTDLISEI